MIGTYRAASTPGWTCQTSEDGHEALVGCCSDAKLPVSKPCGEGDGANGAGAMSSAPSSDAHSAFHCEPLGPELRQTRLGEKGASAPVAARNPLLRRPRPPTAGPHDAQPARRAVPQRFRVLLGFAALAVNMPSIYATLRVQPAFAAAALSALLCAVTTTTLFIPIEIARFRYAPGSFRSAARDPWSAMLPALRFRLLLFSLSAFVGRLMV